MYSLIIALGGFYGGVTGVMIGQAFIKAAGKISKLASLLVF
jgi:hypothetical protein